LAGKRVISGVLTLKDKNFSSGVKKAAAESKDLERKVKQAGNQISNFSRSATAGFGRVATSAAALTAAIGGGVIAGALVSEIVQTEDAFNRLSAKTGAVGSDLEGLKGVASEVFRSGFGGSIGEVANEIGTLQSMFNDLNDNQLKNVAQGAYTISDLWGTGVNEVGKTVKTLTANFEGLSEATAMDLMTTAFQETGDYAGDLLDTFNEYSTYFADMGMNAEEFTNTLIKGSKAGAFNLDKVGDGIKELGIRAIDGSKSTAEGFATIGLNADEMAQKFAAGGESANNAFAATMAGLANIEDPVERNAAGVALMGTQWEDLGADVVMAMGNGENALGEFEGATKRAADTMQSGFGAQMKQTWRDIKMGAAEAFSDAGGGELLSSLATKAQGLVPVIDNMVTGAINFGKTVQNNWPQISTVLGVAKNVLVGVKDGIVGVYNFISNNWALIGPVVAGVAGTIAAFKIGVIAVTTATKTWKAITTGVQIATMLLNGTLAISPLGWVALAIGAVIAVGVLLWQNWDTVREKAGQLWSKTKEVFGGIYDWGVSKIQPVADFFRSLGDKFNDFKNAISNFKLPKWVSSIGSKISGAASKVKNMLPSFDVGTNRVARDMTANIHKDEMIVPARQAERLRAQGVTIDNIDNIANRPQRDSGGTTTIRTENRVDSSSKKNNITIKIYARDKSVNEIVNELIPALKLKLDNM
jgi:phage-related minor tail protein